LGRAARKKNPEVAQTTGTVDVFDPRSGIIIIIIIIIIQYACLLSQAFLPGTSLEPAVIPTAQVSSFTLQYYV